LRIGDDRVVVSVIAGVGIAGPGQTLGTGAASVRAIPLPTVRERRSVTVTHPAHPVADALFDRLGEALPVADESAFSVFSALTGTLTAHYSYLAALTTWATGQGIGAEDAERYVRGLFQGVGRSLSDGERSLEQLARDHETRGGSNERFRTAWFGADNTEAMVGALDALHRHLTQGR
jgi:pyrroline-5-carboxylate reductase